MSEERPNRGRDESAGKDPSTVTMRPKLVWRIGLPPLSVGSVIWAVNDQSIESVFFAAVVSIGSVISWRSVVVVRERIIFRRGLWWNAPLDLASIRSISLHREVGFKDYPHFVLRLKCGDQADQFSTRWWSGWRQLASLLVEHNIEAATDEKTRRRLLAFAEHEHERPTGSSDA